MSARLSTSATSVHHSIKDLEPRADSITTFIDWYGNKTKPVKRVDQLYFLEIMINGRPIMFAKTVTSLRLSRDKVSDFDTDCVKVYFGVIGIPIREGGTTGQVNFDDVEYAVKCLCADALSRHYTELLEGKTLVRNTMH